MLIDDNGPAVRLDTDRFQIQPVCVRCASHGHQQPIGPQFPRVRSENELLIGITDLARLGVIQNLDTLGFERGFNGLANSRVLTGKQPATRQDGHLAAQPGKRLCQLHCHDRRPDDNQPVRNGVAGQCRGGRPVRRIGQARNRGDGRPRTGTNERSVKAYLAFRALGSRHCQRIGIGKTGLTPHDSNRRIVFENALILVATKLIDPGLLLGQQPGPVNGGLACLNTVVERTGAAHVSHVCSPDHNFRGHTADIDAGATDGATFDQRDPCSAFR